MISLPAVSRGLVGAYTCEAADRGLVEIVGGVGTGRGIVAAAAETAVLPTLGRRQVTKRKKE